MSRKDIEEHGAGQAKPRAKRGKYGAIKTTIDGIKFDSAGESRRYLELKELAARGEIVNLRMQPKYVIAVNGFKICDYYGDFIYDTPDGATVVEDSKSVATARDGVFRLKRKLVRAVYGFDVEVVIQPPVKKRAA